MCFRKKEEEYELITCFHCGQVYRRYQMGFGMTFPINCPFCGLAPVYIRRVRPHEWDAAANGKRVFPTPPVCGDVLGMPQQSYEMFETEEANRNYAPLGRPGLHYIIDPNNTKRRK